MLYGIGEEFSEKTPTDPVLHSLNQGGWAGFTGESDDPGNLSSHSIELGALWMQDRIWYSQATLLSSSELVWTPLAPRPVHAWFFLPSLPIRQARHGHRVKWQRCASTSHGWLQQRVFSELIYLTAMVLSITVMAWYKAQQITLWHFSSHLRSRTSLFHTVTHSWLGLKSTKNIFIQSNSGWTWKLGWNLATTKPSTAPKTFVITMISWIRKGLQRGILTDQNQSLSRSSRSEPSTDS